MRNKTTRKNSTKIFKDPGNRQESIFKNAGS